MDNSVVTADLKPPNTHTKPHTNAYQMHERTCYQSIIENQKNTKKTKKKHSIDQH